jgi:CheY-like chemotaxis protein
MSAHITYLLVEDDEGQACLLKKWLIRIAAPVVIDVLIETNLEDGLLHSNERQPSATFLDLLIPLRKGEPPVPVCGWRDVADQIGGFVPPVIVTTGLDITPEIKLYCMNKGAHHVFHKPYDDSFFSRLKYDTQIFAAQLLSAAGDAELRDTLGPAKVDNGHGQT